MKKAPDKGEIVSHAMVFGALLILILGSGRQVAAWEEKQVVKPKLGSVKENQHIDILDEELVSPEMSDLGESAFITSKTFVPPTGWTFKSFGTTYVDIHEEDPADGLTRKVVPPDQRNNKPGRVKVEASGVAKDAGQFPLRCEGNLVPLMEGKQIVELHWSAKMSKEGVKIIRVPPYLYADATAAVPVTFKIFGLGDHVTIRNPKISFVVEGAAQFSQYDVTDRFTKGDGLQNESGNGESDTYTAWVPICEFKLRAPNIMTDEAPVVWPKPWMDKEVRPWPNRCWTTPYGT